MQRNSEDEAPEIVVPINDPATLDSELGVHQYVSEELHTPASTDREDLDNLVFLQHNPNVPFGQINLEKGMEFETMMHFKKVVRKYNIHLGREV